MPTTTPTQTTLLAIDDTAMPLRRNLCFYISTPQVRAEPVLTPRVGDPAAPDNAAAHFYGGVVVERGRYRMWYYACHWDNSRPTDPLLGNLVEGPTCYAESSDGLHWDRPELGQVEWQGSRRNNVVRLAALRSEGVHVIKDLRDKDRTRRYKMVYDYRPPNRPFWTFRTATSPDGLVWTDGPELPYDGFVEQASLYEFGGMYIVNAQMAGRSEGGHNMGRQAMAVVSPDFVRWMPECADSLILPEPADPAARGYDKAYDQAHIGVGAVSLGNVLVGLYGLWHNHPYPTKDDWFGQGATTGDLGLAISNDGLHFREPVKGRVFLHRDQSPPTLKPGVVHARILCQGNGIVNVGDETRIYHGRWANTPDVRDYYGEIALATLPRDRWGALGLFPDAAEGSLWTAPLRVRRGSGLRLNAEGAAGMRVEVGDTNYGLIEGWSGVHSGTPGATDSLDGPVTWAGRSLAELAGKTVRLRIRLCRSGSVNPRLYAAYWR